MGPNIGCITEQGDLGLGFDVLNEKDQSTYQNESNKNTDKDDKNDK